MWTVLRARNLTRQSTEAIDSRGSVQCRWSCLYTPATITRNLCSTSPSSAISRGHMLDGFATVSVELSVHSVEAPLERMAIYDETNQELYFFQLYVL
jgi:hypothetical protein